MSFKVEKNVNLPAIDRGVANRALRASKYPFRSMEPGDSFMVPKTKREAKTREHGNGKYSPPRVAAAAYNFGRHNNMKFAYRMDPEGNVRVWRTQ